MNFEDLDDGYYYILASKKNEKLAVQNALKLITNKVVCERGLPKRPPIIIVESGFPDNKFLIVWEFGVLGEVKIEPEFFN